MTEPSLNPEPISSSVPFQNEIASSTARKRESPAGLTTVIFGICRHGTLIWS
jgi:hypothetical protein